MAANDQDIVERLLTENETFESLHREHAALDHRVSEATKGIDLMNDFEMSTAKKKKLYLKDQMTAIIEEYRRQNNP